MLSTLESVNAACRYLAARNATWKLSSPVALAYGCPHTGQELRRRMKDRSPGWRHFRRLPFPPYFTFRPRP